MQPVATPAFHVGDDHRLLLVDAITERFGSIAGGIVHVLITRGELSLFDVAEALRAGPFDAPAAADDGRIKRAMAVLHEHSVVLYSEDTKCYTVRLGRGLVHVLYPVLLRLVRQRFGDAGAAVFLVLVEYGTLPAGVLSSVTSQRHVALRDAVELAIAELRSAELLVSAETTSSEADPPAAKRHRKETVVGGSALVWTELTICALNIPQLVHLARTEAMVEFIHSKCDDALCGKIAEVLIANDPPSVKWNRDGPNGYPARVECSSSLSLASLRGSVGKEFRDEAFAAALDRLGSSHFGEVVSQSDGQVRLHYHRLVALMKLECAEQVVFSRFGILGVRLMKLLLRHGAMEDRFLADDCIATLTQVREVLQGMMRDGMMRQQEVPRTLAPDRQPKQSIFLWLLTKESLLYTVSTQLVRSLRNIRTRLAVETQRLHKVTAATATGASTASSSSSYGPLTARSAGDNNGSTAIRSAEHAIRVLKTSQFGLMHHVLVMDYF